MHPVARKIAKALRDPGIVVRFSGHQIARWRARAHDRRTFGAVRQRLTDSVLETPPVHVGRDGRAEVHTLMGAATLADALCALTLLYRALPQPYPLVIHEDGTLTAAHVELLEQRFVGCRVIQRTEADPVILGELERRRLPHCAAFRRRSAMGLKLFDLQYFAAGRRVLYLDTDVLFYEYPAELVAAMEEDSAVFVDRYNEDVVPSYAWSEDQVRAAIGSGYPERPVNSGLFVIERPELQWELYEACLKVCPPNYYEEQTLWAADFGARSARPLGPAYDVCFRHAWVPGRRDEDVRDLAPMIQPVVTEHYCGGEAYRRLFYRDALTLFGASSR